MTQWNIILRPFEDAMGKLGPPSDNEIGIGPTDDFMGKWGGLNH